MARVFLSTTVSWLSISRSPVVRSRESHDRAITKNIQVVDGARNCVYDVFAASEDDYVLLFSHGSDVAFVSILKGAPMPRSLPKP